MINEMTYDEIKNIVENSGTYSEIARKIFSNDSYSKRELVKKIIKEYNLEFIHKTKKKKFCVYCGKEIVGKHKTQKKFCSSSCSASYNNKKRKDKHYCVYCGKELENKRNKYCSNQCYKEHKYEQKIKNWKNGEYDGWTGKQAGIKHYIKRYLIKKVNCKCEKCGWAEINNITNEVPLQIHHIDGNCKNNKEENLQVLCPNCHSLTDTFGRLNNKSSRKR